MGRILYFAAAKWRACAEAVASIQALCGPFKFWDHHILSTRDILGAMEKRQYVVS